MYKKNQHKFSKRLISISLCISMLFLVICFTVREESKVVETIVLDVENTTDEEKELNNKKLLVEQWDLDNSNNNALSLIEDKTDNIKESNENESNTNFTQVKAESEKTEVENPNNTEATEQALEQEQISQQIEQSPDTQTQEVMQISDSDYDVLVRIVEAEATGEDIKGKILVANVILNRVNHESFPDTVTDVVFETCGGSPQFSPTADGRFDTVEVTDESREAVNRALSGEDYSNGALYFSARSQADPENMNWFDSHLKWLFKYGGHEFYALKE